MDHGISTPATPWQFLTNQTAANYWPDVETEPHLMRAAVHAD